MTLIIIEIVIVLIGLAVTPVLFYHFPRLPETSSRNGHFPTISVIIPARNEEKNLSLLLKDLHTQSAAPFEIICVDDESSDSTTQIAESYGVKVFSLHDKPQCWTGKSWACQNGANAAKGELLLFLDADVRLEHNGILRLMEAYSDCNCTISVQPFHKTETAYEQFSMLFNFIQIAANGTALPNPLGVGLYGPVILISKSDYNKIGGHESVKQSIVEDMALGARLKEVGIPYMLFAGDKDISFRMYGDGLKGLLQGWIKNMAAGALKTPPHVLGKLLQAPQSYRPTLNTLTNFEVQKALAKYLNGLDTCYWSEKGWDKKPYFFECSTNGFKCIISKIFGAVLQRIMSHSRIKSSKMV